MPRWRSWGCSGEDRDLGPAAAVGALALAVSMIPIWWAAGRSTHVADARGSADLERRLEERLQVVEEEMRQRFGELEDGARQVMDLEERVDFAERLLTKYRHEPLGSPPEFRQDP